MDTPKLKYGYTTGACATACTHAALLSLLKQENISHVRIDLPQKKNVLFHIKECNFDPEKASCSTIKDAGDDPDVTDQAEITAELCLNSSQKILFLPGKGVGIVSLPGLELPIGEPAINPKPRDMMIQTTQNILKKFGVSQKGVSIKISVKDGEKLTKRTLNERVGIRNGISILGSTGIVTPFSTSSYIASIRQGIQVALANASPELILNSGKRSEQLIHNSLPKLPPYAFVHYGNWLNEALNMLSKPIPLKRVN
ncbi:MAG: cobalt-precorrin-5B (C(1))-methyltransferase CbiD, partial [Cytophagales bacterium]|nr:cobalt-precorrin-5B (C(1))-methyltransferase CbiD [Cytophagales bacterium]